MSGDSICSLTSRDKNLMIYDMGLIRGTSLQGYSELVRSLGGDPNALLRAVKIPPSAAGQFDTYLGHRGVIGAIESAATVTGTPDFGRLLAQRQGIEILGPIGAAARTARNFGEALGSFREYLAVYSPNIQATVQPHHDHHYIFLDLRIVLRLRPALRQTLELTLGVTLNILKLFLGPTYRPVSVHVPHEALTPEREYRRYFGAPARFGEPSCGFTILAAELDRPLSDDETAHRALRAYLDSISGVDHNDLDESVQRLISHLLPTGGLSIGVVARQLDLHPRTLQRRLADQGTTFEALVDRTRMDLADRLLRETDMPMTQLAGVLGYSEQSVLVWASRRWFGTTPTHRRRDAQHG